MKKNKTKEDVHKKRNILIWLGAVLLIIFSASFSNKEDTSKYETLKDYVGQDVKTAYEELTNSDYSIKFVFDRKNNGGFSEEDFQNYVINDMQADYYEENPYTVTKQESKDKNVTLYIEYSSVVVAEKAQKEKEEKLEEKLGIVNAMTACQQYGERNYKNFKMHSIIGKIAEYASDDNTWFLKYYVDANGYKNLNMECYVTGTNDNPQISGFTIY